MTRTASLNGRGRSLSDGLAAALAGYLSRQLDRPVTVESITRLAGGTSHETWAFEVSSPGQAQEPLPPLVLRRDFEDGRLLHTGDRRSEFELLGALHDLGLPVPRPRWCETAESPLRSPFLITDRVAGTDVRKFLARTGPTVDRHALGAELAGVQARIHAVDWRAHVPRLAAGAGQPGGWTEIDRWAAPLDSDDRDAEPLVAAAIDHLRADPPPVRRLALLHGDFKANNLIIGPDGFAAALDWEMAHVGDPLEDLAWTMLWTTGSDLVGGLLTPDEYLAAYEACAGSVVDRAALDSWRLFALVKLASIFQAGVPAEAGPASPTLAMTGRAVPYLASAMADHLMAALGSEAA